MGAKASEVREAEFPGSTGRRGSPQSPARVTGGWSSPLRWETQRGVCLGGGSKSVTDDRGAPGLMLREAQAEDHDLEPSAPKWPDEVNQGWDGCAVRAPEG